MHSDKSVLFITLRTFSLVGGIENVCKSMAYSLQYLSTKKAINFKLFSMHDEGSDEKYIAKENFKGFKGNVKIGSFEAFKEGVKSDVVILSHINLSIIALAIKFFSPKTQIILWTHGIEIWRPLSFFQKKLLSKAQIIAVSEFTKNAIINAHSIPEHQIKVIYNSLDPFFDLPILDSNDELKNPFHPIPFFMTLCRLKLSEQRKNYDLIIKIIGDLKKEGHQVQYVICGKYDQSEFDRIRKIAIKYHVANQIIIPGFISKEELKRYYLNANAFVMPSAKEGFGLVFIEAQAHGLRVLCGNIDGSIETLKSKNSGIAIHPDDEESIKKALIDFINHPSSTQQKTQIQKTAIEHFKFDLFDDEIKKLIGVKSLHN